MEDLYTVELVEGLRISNMGGGKATVYKTVLLRESTEQYLHDAIKQVQELRRMPDGNYRLVFNQELFEAARIVKHIAKFIGNGPELHDTDIDLTILGKLHPLDVVLISERLLHIELAAQLRWNLITQDEYDLILQGKSNSKPVEPTEILATLKKMIDAIARVTHTSIESLNNMPLAELEVTLKNLADTGKQ